MRSALLSAFIAALVCGTVAAGDAKDKPKAGEAKENVKADERPRAAPAELSPEWLGAIERLRLLPRPGEIKGSGFVANVAAVYGVPDESAARCEAVQKEYDAALLKLAAKWEQDAKTLRAEYEPKLVQALPQESREPAQKLLTASNTHWVTPYDRETAFRNEFAKRSADLRESKLKITAEEFEEAKGKLQAWVRDTRAKLIQQNADFLKQLREMLGPDNAARLDAIVSPKKAAEEAAPKAEEKKK
jgi:hypothetical protein